MHEKPAPESDRPLVTSCEFARRGPYFLSTDPSLLDVSLIHKFLSEQSYWAPGITREVVERSLENSLCFGLFQESRQIGFARVVTDRATFAWLGDVFVIDEFRGQGLGKWMVGALLEHPDLQGLRRCLLGTRDAHGLYTQFGFTPLADPSRFLEIHRPNLYLTDPRTAS
ncbi:MAG TPA: GNAT family N-acetyltransferase [Planctomycetaceae bacterium]|jgi:GNAT superfamily N-acetyltransferase|nr:GNAT family N-acetyltransferase [Planctomycetaceae bacterium]